jgi:hypothetical protein
MALVVVVVLPLRAVMEQPLLVVLVVLVKL